MFVKALKQWTTQKLHEMKQLLLLSKCDKSPGPDELHPKTTLFIYFINDLPLTSTVETKIFADDTKVYTNIENQQDAQVVNAQPVELGL